MDQYTDRMGKVLGQTDWNGFPCGATQLCCVDFEREKCGLAPQGSSPGERMSRAEEWHGLRAGTMTEYCRIAVCGHSLPLRRD